MNTTTSQVVNLALLDRKLFSRVHAAPDWQRAKPEVLGDLPILNRPFVDFERINARKGCQTGGSRCIYSFKIDHSSILKTYARRGRKFPIRFLIGNLLLRSGWGHSMIRHSWKIKIQERISDFWWIFTNRWSFLQYCFFRDFLRIFWAGHWEILKNAAFAPYLSSFCSREQNESLDTRFSRILQLLRHI